MRHAHLLLLSLTAFALFGVSPAGAQQADAPASDSTSSEPVEVQARTLSGAVQGSQRVRRLIGDVRLRQGETRLWSDRATQYLEGSEILFLGDVLIVERGDTLRADRVLYDSRRKSGQARGNVYLSDGQVEVRAPTGRYFSREQRARFDDGLVFTDSATTVTSEAGTYFSGEKRAIFQRNVRLRKPDTRMQSDSMTYLRDREIAEAYGNVLLENRDAGSADSSWSGAGPRARTFLYGDQVFTDEQRGISRAAGRPLLIRLRPDTVTGTTDTLLIRASHLEALRSDTLRRLTAVDSVRIWQSGGIAAVSDSAVSTRRPRDDGSVRRVMRLFGAPLAWQRSTQISGDTIRFTGTEDELERLFVPTSPFVVRPDTVTGRLNQLKGRQLTGRFREGALRTVHAGPNAEMIYFLEEEGRPNGAVKTSGDSIRFAFQNDALQKISVMGGTEGIRYPESKMPSPFRLEGFRWEPELRPAPAALLERLPPELRPLPAPGDDARDGGGDDEPPPEPPAASLFPPLEPPRSLPSPDG